MSKNEDSCLNVQKAINDTSRSLLVIFTGMHVVILYMYTQTAQSVCKLALRTLRVFNRSYGSL